MEEDSEFRVVNGEIDFPKDKIGSNNWINRNDKN